MTACIVCHGDRARLYQGSHPNSTDQWVCRPCQREPMPQLRAFLERARVSGFDFDKAWTWALERVRWPHDTPTRREWKWMLGVEIDGTIVQALTVARVRATWHAAYTRTVAPRALAELVAVA